MPSLNKSNVHITRIDYDYDTKKIVFYFLHDNVEKLFSTTAEDLGKIQLISATSELEEFLTCLLSIDFEVIQRFHRITWDYIKKRREIIFPVQLI
ncbi:hypothetical protein [Xenorhabdus miraniensis]|uniref:Uncharacterized protein n=1 Tax=Xenorhabdus miraniensis TaxID=351674 RepID=A0A2D0JJL0_9GAMM|nr:hypothetical protein [Xenorhabdus miraniensis]PHM45614.1 hypothetical protein Xmir_04213 [Xenorhabdus miraniensis]